MPRSRISLVLDWLTLLLAVAFVTIALTGGGVFRIGGARITARSADRAALAVVVVIALRYALDRRTPAFAGPRRFASRVRDLLYDPARDEHPPLPHETRWRRYGVALAGLSVFGAVLLHAQLAHMDSVPDLGDPLFSIWRAGWVHHKLLGDPRPLFSPNIYYPAQLTFTYSDSMLLPAMTTVPFLLGGLHPVYAYNVVVLLSFVASGFAMYLLAEKLTSSPAAGFAAALLFAFHPYRFEHYSHFELLMTYCMPLALLALHRFVATARVRDAIATSLLAVGQLYSSMYYAVFFVISASVVFASECIMRQVNWRRFIVPALVAGAVALALAWPLARTYTSARLGDRDADTVRFYSAEASDYLRAHPRSMLWAERTIPGRQPERALFPGAVILILAALALVPPLGTWRALYAIALLVSFEISRGFNSPFYPYLYDWLPFIRGLRVPARCSILVGMSLAVLAGFGVRRVIAGRARGTSMLVMAVLTAAIAIDLRPNLQLEPVWLEPPPIYGAVTGNTAVVLAEYPLGGSHRGFTANVPFMYFSLWHWANMVNGYSGHSPPDEDKFEQGVERFPEPQTLDLLRSRGVTHVTINCALLRPRSCDHLFGLVDAVPDLKLVTSGKWEGLPVRLYELKR